MARGFVAAGLLGAGALGILSALWISRGPEREGGTRPTLDEPATVEAPAPAAALDVPPEVPSLLGRAPLPGSGNSSAVLRLQVQDASGAPLGGVSAKLVRQDELLADGSDGSSEASEPESAAASHEQQASPALQVSSDREGRVEFRQVAPGRALTLILEGPARILESLKVAPLFPREERDLGAIVLATGATIRGIVTDADLAPLAGARVSLVRSTSSFHHVFGDLRLEREMGADLACSAVTDDSGAFVLAGLSDSTYKLQASYPGMLEGTLDVVRVPEDAGQVLQLRLVRGSVVKGVVLDEDLNPIADARVARMGSLVQQAREFAVATLEQEGTAVEASGSFSLGGLSQDRPEVVLASAPGRVILARPGVMPGTDVQLVLPRSFALTGRVVDAERNGMKAVTLDIEAGDDRLRELIVEKRTESEADGSFLFEGLPAGEYRVIVTSPVGRSEHDSIWVGEAATPVELAVAASAALSVRVATETGDPIEDVLIDLIPLDLPASGSPGDVAATGAQARTDETGEARMHGVVPGRYRIQALWENATLVERDEEIPRLPWSIDLLGPRLGALVLDVIDEKQNTVSGVAFQLLRPRGDDLDAVGPRLRADDRGKVVWSFLAPGSYEVLSQLPSARAALGQKADHLGTASRIAVDILPGMLTSATFVLREYVVKVQVLRAGAPIVAGVSIARDGYQEIGEVLMALIVNGSEIEVSTNRHGWATLVVPEPGRYVLHARSSANTPLTTLPIEVTATGQTFTLNLAEGMVLGHVTRYRSDEPVADARVKLVPSHAGGAVHMTLGALEDKGLGDANISMALGETVATTDSSGNFRFLEVAAGNYVVEIEHPAYSAWSSYDLALQGDSFVDCGLIELVPACVLRGTVHHELQLDPASITSYGLVRLIGEDGRLVGTAFLEKDGSFEFTRLAPGKYHLVAQVDDTVKQGEVFEISARGVTTQEIRLP